MQPPKLIFQLSDNGEYIVRTYACTHFKRWFRTGLAIGYLTVTNRRIVFHSKGDSPIGNSLLITEMPLEDVAGLNMYEGISINWWLLLLFVICGFVVMSTIDTLLPHFLVSYGMAIVLMLPFSIVWLLSSKFLNNQIKERIIISFESFIGNRIQINRDVRTYLPYTKVPTYIGLLIFVWRFTHPRVLNLSVPWFGWILLLGFLGFIYMVLIGNRQHSFSLYIASKTAKDSGIFIPGDTLSLFSTHDTTALQALGARPAKDASKVIQELGAMLMDIRLLGDIGIQKWKQ